MQQNLSVVGVDLAKRVFPVAGREDTGKIVLRKRCARPNPSALETIGQWVSPPLHIVVVGIIGQICNILF
jgi:hypothetical protein